MLFARWLASIIILPGTALGIIPAILVYISPFSGLTISLAPVGDFRFWLSLLPCLLGTALGIWTMALFFVSGGDGTLAPWDPPKRLVIRGPYRHVRNPMIIGIILMLIGMAGILGSILVIGWALLFFTTNTLYFVRSEEPALLKRFGEDYATYCVHVNRWIPRIKPWQTPPRMAI